MDSPSPNEGQGKRRETLAATFLASDASCGIALPNDIQRQPVGQLGAAVNVQGAWRIRGSRSFQRSEDCTIREQTMLKKERQKKTIKRRKEKAA
jgi:hypothetical protein